MRREAAVDGVPTEARLVAKVLATPLQNAQWPQVWPNQVPRFFDR
jgi:hypothetical protein